MQHQLTDTLSVEAAYVGNRGSNAFVGRRPGDQRQPADRSSASRRACRPTCGGRSSPATSPTLRASAAPSAGRRASTTSATARTNDYNSLQTKVTKRFGSGYSLFVQYTLQHAVNNDGDYFFIDPDVNRGTADFDRTHTFDALDRRRDPGRPRQALPVGRLARASTRSSAAGSSTRTRSSRAASRSTCSYRNAGQDRDTGPNRPDLIGDPDGPQTRDQWFNAAADRRPGQRLRATGDRARSATSNGTPCAGRATGGPTRRCSRTSRCPATPARGPARGRQHLQPREPGQSRTRRSACRARRTPNAGRITSTAFGNGDPQRNFQFGLRFVF